VGLERFQEILNSLDPLFVSRVELTDLPDGRLAVHRLHARVKASRTVTDWFA
jgi:hypothetical protein